MTLFFSRKYTAKAEKIPSLPKSTVTPRYYSRKKNTVISLSTENVNNTPYLRWKKCRHFKKNTVTFKKIPSLEESRRENSTMRAQTIPFKRKKHWFILKNMPAMMNNGAGLAKTILPTMMNNGDGVGQNNPGSNHEEWFWGRR